MKRTSLAVVGGFLGAGKTTSILNIAKYLIGEGKKIGIVTNDQGSELVDTNFLLQSGLPVLEVTGGCFCCNFEEFANKVNELSKSSMPDIILAEPVGSCTDLIATIFKPIKQKYTKEFSLSPLSIIADPKRVKKLMMEDESSPFPSEINYLFKKQLEEADIIVLNKIDILSEAERDCIVSFLKEKYKGIDVLQVSAKTGFGMKDWINLIDSSSFHVKPSLDIDYETYAAAEGHLGWLNSTVLLNSKEPHDANIFITELMEHIKKDLINRNIEIAHLKIYEITDNDFAKASLTSIYDNIDFNKKMDENVSTARLIINARINTSPDILKDVVEDALKVSCSINNILTSDYKVECFKPKKPKPKYRIK